MAHIKPSIDRVT